MVRNTGPTRPFGMMDRLGYMFGDFGNDFTFLLSSMFLMKFYTDVMDVAAGLVGAMMMLARVVDAFTDVAMGQICDRSRPGKKGKFAPWLRRMCGPVALASFLMYAVWFKTMPMGFKIFWMLFTYLLWGSIFYTSINIPYGSMASAITAEPNQRASLSSFRTVGATLASTVIGVVLPLVVYYEDANGNTVLSGEKMAAAALACSIGAVICYLLCYVMTTERVKMEKVTEKFSFKKLLKVLIGNRALIGIVVAALLLLLAQLTLSGMGNFIYPNYFGNREAMSVATMLSSLITILLSTVIVRLASAYGKRELSTMGALVGAGAMLLAFFLHTKNVWVFVGLYMAATLGFAFFNLLCWSMITDVIDDDEIRTGTRSDGTIYAVYSFARKLGQAASAGLTGGLLSLAGYTAATAFDTSVVNGIYNITCLVPAAGFLLLALGLRFLYPLNKNTVEKNAQILKEKRGE